MGKCAKPDLSYLVNDLFNNSMKSISWQLINIIPKNLCTKNTEKLSNRFWENWQKVAKQPNLTFFYFSNLDKWPLEWVNQIHLLAVHLHPPWEASCQNREKVIKQFFEKIASKWQMGQIWPFWPFKLTFRMIQPNPHLVHWYLPDKAPCQRRKKVIKQFLRNKDFKWKVDDDDDGRRRRITRHYKSSAAFRLAELKKQVVHVSLVRITPRRWGIPVLKLGDPDFWADFWAMV